MNKRIKKKVQKRKQRERRELMDRSLRLAIPHMKLMMEVFSGTCFLCRTEDVKKLKRTMKIISALD